LTKKGSARDDIDKCNKVGGFEMGIEIIQNHRWMISNMALLRSLKALPILACFFGGVADVVLRAFEDGQPESPGAGRVVGSMAANV
jgi:hypothetical protein